MEKSKNRLALEKILVKYINEFEKKHDMDFDFAVQDDLTDVLCFGDILYFSMIDIIFDVDNNLPKGMIIEWLEYNMENQPKTVNLYSYSKGYRHEA